MTVTKARKATKSQKQIKMENDQLLHQLNDCITACNACYNACLNEKDINMLTRCIELDRECADICQFAVSLLTRDSENAGKILDLCAEICEDCAVECEKHEHDHCLHCAKVCRSCADACKNMVY